MSAEREVIFEFLRIGAALKVTAVDVASGVEARPGVKDEAKVRNFFKATRAATVHA